MTLDARHDDNLRYVRQVITQQYDSMQCSKELERRAHENGKHEMEHVYLEQQIETSHIIKKLERIESHMTEDDKQEWLNTPLPKGTLLEAAHKRADLIAPDYGWQDDSPQYNEYVNQMAPVMYEFIGALVEKGLKEAGKAYMDSFCAEIFDEVNSVNPEAIEESCRQMAGRRV